jgi:PGF-pre-PGF domain-containing protein
MAKEVGKMWCLKNIKELFLIKNKFIEKFISIGIISVILVSSFSLIFVLSVGADDGSIGMDVDFLKDSYSPSTEPKTTTPTIIEPKIIEKQSLLVDPKIIDISSENTSVIIEKNNDESQYILKNDEIIIEKNIGDISIGYTVNIKSGRSNDTSIKSLEFKTKADFNNVNLSITKLNEKPVDIIENPIGNCTSYVYLDIKLTSNDVYMHEEEFEFLKFQFKVYKSWMENNNIELESITLVRFHNEWQPLPTIFLFEDEFYLYFEAESPGLSIYTVVGTEIVEGSPDLIINRSFIPINGWIAIIVFVSIMLLTIVYKLKFIYKDE